MSKCGNLHVAPSELPHLRFAKSRVMWPCGEKSRCFSASKAEVLRPRLRGLNRNMAQRMQRIDGWEKHQVFVSASLFVQNQPLKTKYFTFWFHLFFSQYPHPKWWRDVFDLNFFVVFAASQSLEWASRTLCPESFPWWQIAQALESRQKVSGWERWEETTFPGNHKTAIKTLNICIKFEYLVQKSVFKCWYTFSQFSRKLSNRDVSTFNRGLDSIVVCTPQTNLEILYDFMIFCESSSHWSSWNVSLLGNSTCFGPQSSWASTFRGKRRAVTNEGWKIMNLCVDYVCSKEV